MNCIVRTFLLISLCICVSLISLAQSRVSSAYPSVNLAVECRTSNQFRFRLQNRTAWMISVPTFKNYFAWTSVGTSRKPKKAALESGGSVFVLPEDVEIDSLLYFLEREAIGLSGFLIEPVDQRASSHNVSWIERNSSIFFMVDAEKIADKRSIYVKFNYEWELSKQGVFVGGLNEHLAVVGLSNTISKNLRTCD